MVDEVKTSTLRGTYVYWVFTAFIKSDIELMEYALDVPDLKETLSKVFEEKINKLQDFCKYYAMQLEKCPETGRYHIQGYLHVKKKCGISSIIQKFKDCEDAWFWCNPHFEKCKSTHLHCLNYCTKEDTRVLGPWVWPLDYKEEKGKGKRSDLDKIVELANSGFSIDEIAAEHPTTTLRYNKHIQWYIDSYNRRNGNNNINFDNNIEVTCLIGPAGCGKTRYVIEKYPDCFQLTKNGDTIWFDGYSNQEVLLIDDFDGWIPFKMFLKITDKYSNLTLPIKGSTAKSKWKKVFITSNSKPDSWYTYKSDHDKQAVIRRISHTINMFNEIENDETF